MTEHEPKQIYVVDADNRPLAVMPVEEVHSQNLRHRGFFLLLTDSSGRLVLRRRTTGHPASPGNWDIPGSGHTGIDEAADEAAERALPDVLQSQELSPHHSLHLESGAGTGNEAVDVFEIRIPDRMLHHFTDSLEYLLVDQDEFHALAASYRDCFTAELATVWDRRLYRWPDMTGRESGVS